MRQNARIELSSLSAAIIIVANSLCWPFSSIDGVLAVFVLLAFLLFLLAGNRVIHKETLPLLAIVCIFFLFSFFSMAENATLRSYFMGFASLGFVGLTCAGGLFDIRKTILYICGISVLLIPFIARMDFSNLDYGVWMGISYGTLKYIIALSFAAFFLDWKSFKIRLLFSLPLLFYARIYAAYASRGAILSLLIFILLAFMIKYNISKLKALLILSFIGVVTYALFIPIISVLFNALNDAGIYLYAFDKILMYGAEGNIDNGRDSLVEMGMVLFSKNPIWGNGIAYFEQCYNTIYVHNFVVQLLIEGGLLIGVPLILLSFYPVILLFDQGITKEKRLFIAFLFTSSVVGLLFSDTLWRSQCYWFYLGYSLSIIYQKQNSNKQRTCQIEVK